MPSTLPYDRPYSIACGEQDEALLILYRVIPEGKLTPHLITLKPGDPLECTGPFGSFVLHDPARPLVFIATGTGIAPCRGFIKTYPQLNLTVIHGVRAARNSTTASCLNPIAIIPASPTRVPHQDQKTWTGSPAVSAASSPRCTGKQTPPSRCPGAYFEHEGRLSTVHMNRTPPGRKSACARCSS